MRRSCNRHGDAGRRGGGSKGRRTPGGRKAGRTGDGGEAVARGRGRGKGRREVGTGAAEAVAVAEGWIFSNPIFLSVLFATRLKTVFSHYSLEVMKTRFWVYASLHYKV